MLSGNFAEISGYEFFKARKKKAPFGGKMCIPKLVIRYLRRPIDGAPKQTASFQICPTLAASSESAATKPFTFVLK